MNYDAYLPHEAKILERIQEAPTLFTLRLCFTDSTQQKQFAFQPGQFNMLYLYSVGEVAISIVSDSAEAKIFEHTIRIVGRVTKTFAKLTRGDRIGVRGPFGRGWPLAAARNKDIVIVTGGLGCAPTVSAINYIMQRRRHYGAVKIFQGIKHSSDLIFKERYHQWQQSPNTEIIIAADKSERGWPWHTGFIIELFQQTTLDAENTVAMLCGPEAMMNLAAQMLLQKKVAAKDIYLSMERNMECALGHCGHCQYGGLFICKNGPIFAYSEIKNLLGVAGF